MNNIYHKFLCFIISIALLTGPLCASDGEETKKSPFGYTISKETTWFTEPVRADGSLNMAEAINNWCKQGVTSDNNLAIDLIEILGAENFLDETIRQQVLDRLGVKASQGQGCFIPYDYFKRDGDSFVDIRLLPDYSGQELAISTADLLDKIKRQPFSSKDYPEISFWLDANKKYIDRFVDISVASLETGSGKNRFYVPMVASDINDPVIATLLPSLGLLTKLARATLLRAMVNVNDGNYGQAIREFMSAMVLGRSLDRSNSVITALVGCALERLAFEQLSALIVSGKLSEGQLLRVEKFLGNLKPPTYAVEYVANGQCCRARATVLDMADNRSRCFISLVFDKSQNKYLPPQKYFSKNIDWDHVLFRVNSEIEKMLSIINTIGPESVELTEDFEEHIKQIRENVYFRILDISQSQLDEIKKQAANQANPQLYLDAKLKAKANLRWHNLFKSDKPEDLELRSDILADLIIFVFPEVAKIGGLDLARPTQVQLCQLAISLEKFRLQTGSYPEKLQELVDSGLYKGKLTDSFKCKIIYRKNQQGDDDEKLPYLLYSFGRNYKDDHGYRDGEETDDLAIGSYKTFWENRMHE